MVPSGRITVRTLGWLSSCCFTTTSLIFSIFLPGMRQEMLRSAWYDLLLKHHNHRCFSGRVQVGLHCSVLPCPRVQHHDVKPVCYASRSVQPGDEAVAEWISTGGSGDKYSLQDFLIQGTGCEMYTETLSTSFIGMTFSQAAETCFVKVNSRIINQDKIDNWLSAKTSHHCYCNK